MKIGLKGEADIGILVPRDEPSFFLTTARPSLDNLLVAAGGSDGCFTLVERDTMIPKHRFELARSSPVTDLAWIGNNILLASDERDIHIVDVERMKEVATLKGHTECIIGIRYNPVTNILVSGGMDKFVFLWDLRLKKPFNTCLAHSRDVTSVDISFDGSVVLTTGLDGYCRVFSVFTGKCLKTITIMGSPDLSNAKMTLDGRFALITALDGSLSLWDLQTLTMVKAYKGHINGAFIVESHIGSWNNASSFVLAGGDDGTVRIWDYATAEPLAALSLIHI
eukprot:TRINITY_DN7567_c0_g1_i5.p1 TRINITY_DN7567_c0_g1~~TRINITY_DN7567_c0_g1_i5.p1  ORF type:complete len:280 (+),score=45.66 TRINITY_DN7567_c0_g1_i5:150-989(+)